MPHRNLENIPPPLPQIQGKGPVETVCPECKERTTTTTEKIWNIKVVQIRLCIQFWFESSVAFLKGLSKIQPIEFGFEREKSKNIIKD